MFPALLSLVERDAVILNFKTMNLNLIKSPLSLTPLEDAGLTHTTQHFKIILTQDTNIFGVKL